jgi:hypothetical protein
MDESVESCPLTKKKFIEQLLKSNPNYNESELDELYTFFKKTKKGGKIIQKGGVKCGDLNSIYRISCIFLLVLAGITCVTSQSVTDIINHIIFVFKDMLDIRHFRHGFDIMGKTSMTLGFLERFTRFFLEIKEKGITPNWLKNIFEIFCEVENNNINLQDAKQQITNIILTEAIKNEKKYVSDVTDTDLTDTDLTDTDLTYNGREIKINIGDAILTISPNMYINSSIIDDDFEEKFHNKLVERKGGKRRKTKDKKNKKVKKTKRNKRK